jgi:hypothetical protein
MLRFQSLNGKHGRRPNEEQALVTWYPQMRERLIDSLRNNTDLSRDPLSAIGWYLKDENEVTAMQSLVGALERVIESVGRDGVDADYIASPLWADVVRAGSDALAITTSNGPRST